MAKTAHEILRVREKAREIDLAEGKLLLAEDVEKVWWRVLRQIRQALVNWPAQISPVLAAELRVDGNVLSCALEQRVREFLQAQADLPAPDEDPPTTERNPQ
jgi:hypothetical protein